MIKMTWKSPKPSFSFIPRVRRAAAQRTLDIAEAVWQGAVDRTPVDSGNLRASWNISKGKPILLSMNTGVSGAPSAAPGMPALTVTALGSAKFFVTNGKDYAGHVEYGSSTITPKLMLTRAIQSIDL
jgi:hypothetical protein